MSISEETLLLTQIGISLSRRGWSWNDVEIDFSNSYLSVPSKPVFEAIEFVNEVFSALGGIGEEGVGYILSESLYNHI